MVWNNLVVAIALVGCGGKVEDNKKPVAEGVSDSTGAPPPPRKAAKPIESKPLPPLAADTGESKGTAKWVVGFGGFRDDTPRAVAVGADGSTYVVGSYEGEMFVGEQKFPNRNPETDPKKKTGSDAYLVKLDPAGKVAWVKTWGAKRDDVATDVAVKGDKVVVVGHFLDEMTIGEFTKKAAGSDDMFVAAFDTKGEVDWVWTGGGIDSDGFNAIAAAPDGGWVIGGSFVDGFDIGPTHVKTHGKAPGSTDAILIKLKAGGDTEWVKTFGGNFDETILHLAIDANGAIIAQGHFKDVSDWGGTPLKAGGGSDNDVVLAKYDANGEHLWSHGFGNAFNDVAGGVAVDPSGAIVMTGSFDKTISFGKGDSHTAAGESDIYVARFSPGGDLEWAKTWGADRDDQGFGIAVDRFGNAVASGFFVNGVDFGTGTVTSKNLNKDVYVIKLDPKGNTVWVKTFGDKDHDHGRAVAMDDAGNPTVVGSFRFAIDLVNPPVDSMHVADDKAPPMDTFVVRMDK